MISCLLSTIFKLLWLVRNFTGVPLTVQLSPKVFIIDFFSMEQSTWFGIPEFDLLARNITIPGLSPKDPDVHCTKDGAICQVLTSEGEINAATAITALIFSSAFDLRNTYFLLAGIAGINPHLGTLGSVAFSRYAVQATLQYEIDAREKPSQFPGGYFPQGTSGPDMYPLVIYGTEVFELNDALRQRAIAFARTAVLNDTADAQAYRAKYAAEPAFAAAVAAPSVIACDSATADTFWTGSLLATDVERTVKLLTNDSGTYCTAQQEDNAALAALLRGALAGRVDFGRIVEMRTGSNFDRPPPGMSALDGLLFGMTVGPGFQVSLENIYLAGVKVVQGIIANWGKTFAAGVPAQNYVGDILGSLGGAPDFGIQNQTSPPRKAKKPPPDL
ncbi:purine nucleoside permease [Vararia minispora EC-137]|uniref:Purine nucleoside permease n=1 Tax=Vararia minispora EC-137 TaxID=1314806 RepID=A0ACB8QB24_9AGAM|nr:purine nucleoside permease [Vararia minispora EC-137]